MSFLVRIASLGLALAITAGAALAQGAEISVDISQQDSSQPIEITSDSLRLDRDANTAIFEGHVVAVQGTMTLNANHVLVEYAPDPVSGRNEIERVTATGDVVMVKENPEDPTAKPDVAESQVAVYTLATEEVVMTEKVLVVQDTTVLTSDKLTYYLDTGRGVMEGNVTTLLVPSEQ